MILKGLRNFGGGGSTAQPPPITPLIGTILNFTAPAISQSAEEVDELLSAAGIPVQIGVLVSCQCRLCVINMYDVSALSTATCITLTRADRPVRKHYITLSYMWLNN